MYYIPVKGNTYRYLMTKLEQQISTHYNVLRPLKTQFFPIRQRDKLFAPLQVHKGLYVMFQDIHLTAQRNELKFEGVGCQTPENVLLAILIANDTVFSPFVRGKNFFPPF